MERLGINSTFNPGAIGLDGKIYLAVRVEGTDRKSFFAIAESPTGIDRFRFWDYPVVMPETDDPDINVYDMRLVRHQDGWIYGLFCTERKDPNAPRGDLSSAVAQCGIARTKDLKTWERLDDLKTRSPQQRNVVLHPEFLYAFMTALDDPSRLIYEPGGYLLAPRDEERVGDVSNVTVSNGWVARDNGQVLIYYASSDTRCHVATTTVEKLVDYCMHTPSDPLRSAACVQQRIDLIRRNLQVLSAARTLSS